MACIPEIHVNDEGTVIRLLFEECDEDTGLIGPVDLGPATAIVLTFRKPDNTNEVKTGVLLTDGSDGIATYTTEVNFLSLPGNWRVQGKATFTNGEWNSSIEKFKVRSNL